LQNQLPASLMLKYATTFKNNDLKKKALRLQKTNQRLKEFLGVFEHFYEHDWCYEVKKIIEIMNMVSPEEKNFYNCNPKTIDWVVFTQLNVYGYQKYVFKQDVSLPHLESSNLIQKQNYKFF